MLECSAYGVYSIMLHVFLKCDEIYASVQDSRKCSKVLPMANT